MKRLLPLLVLVALCIGCIPSKGVSFSTNDDKKEVEVLFYDRAKDIYLLTLCDEGNRLYMTHKAITVSPNDPSCSP